MAVERLAYLRASTSNVSSRIVRPNGKAVLDRKSTRLNSSHANISYAVFCLKKKKKINQLLLKKEKRNIERQHENYDNVGQLKDIASLNLTVKTTYRVNTEMHHKTNHVHVNT